MPKETAPMEPIGVATNCPVGGQGGSALTQQITSANPLAARHRDPETPICRENHLRPADPVLTLTAWFCGQSAPARCFVGRGSRHDTVLRLNTSFRGMLI